MGLYDEWKIRNSATSSEKQIANVEFVLKNLDLLTNAVIKSVFPVGSIYMSVSNLNPANWISGTSWVEWGSGRVPVGFNASETEFDVVEKTGGSKTVTLTTDQIPAHKHSLGEEPVACGSFNLWELGNDLHESNRYIRNSITETSTDGGNGDSHQNLQPYITCYMWKRTA